MDQTRGVQAQYLNNASARELETRILATKADLLQKLNALADEVRTQVTGSVGRVTDKVHLSVEDVTAKVDASVSQMSCSLHQSVQQVTGSIDTAIFNVRESFDVPLQVRRRPLKMFGLSVLAGVVMAQFGGKDKAATAEHRPYQVTLPTTRVKVSPLAFVGLAAALVRPVLLSTARQILVNSVASRFAEPSPEARRMAESRGAPVPDATLFTNAEGEATSPY